MNDENTRAMAPVPTQNGLRPVVGARTDVGRSRKRNEDSIGVEPAGSTRARADGWLGIVADGLGGRPAGDVASHVAVDTTSAAFYEGSSAPVDARLKGAVERANQAIFEEASHPGPHAGMSSTITAAVIHGDQIVFAQVGDTRGYLVRDGAIRRVTKDHSVIAEAQRAGLLSEEEARHHPQRNLVTRVLGSHARVEVDLVQESLRAGDVIVLCSDGLHGVVEDAEIAKAVEDDPQAAADALVALANERGGPDNISVVVARMEGSEVVVTNETLSLPATAAHAPQRPSGRRGWVVAGIVALAAVLLLYGGWRAVGQAPLSAGVAPPPAPATVAPTLAAVAPPVPTSIAAPATSNPLAEATSAPPAAVQPVIVPTSPAEASPAAPSDGFSLAVPLASPEALVPLDPSPGAQPAPPAPPQPESVVAPPVEPPSAPQQGADAGQTIPDPSTQPGAGVAPPVTVDPSPAAAVTARFRPDRTAFLRSGPRLGDRLLAEVESGSPVELRVLSAGKGDTPLEVPPTDRTDVWYEVVWPQDATTTAFVHCSAILLVETPAATCNPPDTLIRPLP
jgi:protein phosphatase